MTVQARDAVAFSSRQIMATIAASPGAPVWLRVGCLAWSRHDGTGHARLATGELGRLLGGLSPAHTSNALAQARDRGWVDACSTSRCIVIPGVGPERCEERHR